MTALEVIQSVRYITVRDKRYAFVDAEEWESIVDWIETLEDLQVFRQATAELEAAGNDPEQAGWLRWDDIRDELA